ncbi:MAG TPA: c-type cytochrome, partial [Candidatus Acidoferrum sp.]|nr:c-type cytochrome [Candidatus Acidoferrum sp.]
IGSPTGVLFPLKAKLPSKYRNAFWMMDWSYGRIVAVHLKPHGAGYTGSYETVLRGKPLNVTDMEVGPDGAIYFATGGRGTQSGLYRVSFVGFDSSGSEGVKDDQAARMRGDRHRLETFHGKRDEKAVAAAWPFLNSIDRYLRYAARIAVEAQPVEEWKSRAISETNPQGALTALLALARAGTTSDQPDLFSALKKFPTASLPEEQQLLKLRVIEVSIARHGRPSDEVVKTGIEKLSPLYPAKSWPLNRELSQILIALGAPDVVKKSLDLVSKAETQEEQLHYIVALRNVTNGWTIDDRKRYLSWFTKSGPGEDAGPTYPAGGSYFINASTKHPAQFVQWFEDVGIKAGNGASYKNFITKLKLAVVQQLTPAERAQLAPLLVEKAAANISAAAANRKIVQEWKMSDFAADLEKPSRGRNFARGKEMFSVAQCVQCHNLAGEGGAIGPDLAGAGAKYTRRDLLESIIEPSKVLSDQYQNIMVTTKNGDDIVGRLVDENDKTIGLVPNLLTGDRIEVSKTSIQDRRPSALSPMPEGLVSILTRDEILDLVAYMEAGGRKEHAVFQAARK